jgi:hypothetical protein
MRILTVLAATSAAAALGVFAALAVVDHLEAGARATPCPYGEPCIQAVPHQAAMFRLFGGADFAVLFGLGGWAIARRATRRAPDAEKRPPAP